ncbi:MAG: hypothetical protein ACRYG5_14865 [Janthinobacterium lividum]
MTDRTMVCHEPPRQRHCTIVDALEVIRIPALRDPSLGLRYYTEAVHEEGCKQLLTEEPIPVYRHADSAPNGQLSYQLDVDPYSVDDCKKIFVQQNLEQRFAHFTPQFSDGPRPYAENCQIPAHLVAPLGEHGLQKPRPFKPAPRLVSRDVVIAMANRSADAARVKSANGTDAAAPPSAPSAPRKRH